MSPVDISPECLPVGSGYGDLRSVKWRINLGVLPSYLSSTIDDLRRVTADSRRRYARLRRNLLIDPQLHVCADDSPDLLIDDPLSQNPDSTWGRFFQNAELEKMVDNDLTRLYPEHGSYFQTSGCQGLLRRILLLWCLMHPECGYRQGMHELLAPLLYVLHADIRHRNEVRKLYEDHFIDKFDEVSFHGSHGFNFKISSSSLEDDDDTGSQERSRKHTSLSDLDANIQTIILLSDPYGADGELGIVLSEKFMEHDAYCMLDALMSGAGGTVAMAEFFSHSSANATQTGLTPVIEASLGLYHLLSIVDSSLYSHLVELGVEPHYFALRWLRVLFGREFSLENLLTIWDEIFSFDNSKLIKAAGQDPGILSSSRGAFISALAVSMMLNVRSSLLATEYPTSCLQRLLNYPENVELEKLIGKAKSIVALALEASASSHSISVVGHVSQSKRTDVGDHSHSLSFSSSSPRTPVSPVPERYWEEKWRVIHQEEETKNESSPKEVSSKRKSWTERMKLRLTRTESDPFPSKKEGGDSDRKSVWRSLLEDLSRELNFGEDTEESRQDKSSDQNDPPFVETRKESDPFPSKKENGDSDRKSVRRSLLEDLSRELNFGEDTEESGQDKSSDHNDPLFVESHVAMQDDLQESVAYIDNTCSSLSSVSDDHSHIFSDPASPVENNSEKSSIASSTSQGTMDGGIQNFSSFESTVDDDPFPISVAPDANGCEISGTNNNPTEPPLTVLKERNTLSGKFQWFWRFGRLASAEGVSDKLEPKDERSAVVGNLQGNKLAPSRDETNHNPVNIKTDGCDQNLICTLKNFGQSMLENIEVIESVFQQERGQVGSLEHISKHALVEKGQATAITALKELRKISSLLREL